MKKYLKLIYILSTILILANCTAKTNKTKNIKQAEEAIKESSVQVAKTEKNEVSKKNAAKKQEKEKAETENKPESVKKETSYLSDDKHFYEEGSLLFYNLNINDSFEEVKEKVKKFGVESLLSTNAMPKELKEMGCKAYVPDFATYRKDEANDFYIIFKDNKLIRFIKYRASHLSFYKFYTKYLMPNREDMWDREDFVAFRIEKLSYKGYSYYEESINTITYRIETYYPTEMSTVIITKDAYKKYFEKHDKISDEIMELGDLYLYGLHIKDNMDIVKKKLNEHNIKYKDTTNDIFGNLTLRSDTIYTDGHEWLKDMEYLETIDIGEGERGIGAYLNISEKMERVEWEKSGVYNENDIYAINTGIVNMHLNVPAEQAYILLHYFKRKYKIELSFRRINLKKIIDRYEVNLYSYTGNNFRLELYDYSLVHKD